MYLDFPKAFDMVCHQHLLMKIKSFGIHGTFLKWFESKGFLLTVKAQSGLILFIIYVNDMWDVTLKVDFDGLTS